MNGNSLLWPNHSSVNIFGMEIYWYAIIIVFGMMAAFFVICLPIAIVTTRLFYCITAGMPFKDWFNFQSIRQGGLAITGGILGGAASVIGVCYFKKVNFFRAGDCIVVGLLLAQSIGRWGNFVNQEVYGGLVTNEALQFFPISVFIEASNEWHYAFFFYESMVTLLAAIALFLNAWFNPKKPNGINTACYFIIYGLTRAIMEPLRDSSFILNGGGIPWSFVFSLVLLAGGLGLLGYVLINNQRKEGQLLGSKDNDPYGITKFIGDTKTETAYFDNVNVMCSIYPENYSTKAKKVDDKIEITEETEDKKEDE